MTTPHNHHPHRDHAAHGPTPPPGSLRCPECGEPARPVPPRDWPLDGFASRPDASHHDGTPLCPVPGPTGSQPAEPIGAPARLTIWTIADHLAWLDDEGYDTGTLTGDPAEVVGRWLADHRRTAPVPRPTDDPTVYMVAGGDMVAVFDSAEKADIMAVTMTAANLEPVTLPLTEAQWEQAHAVLRSQQPHITVTDARSSRTADAS